MGAREGGEGRSTIASPSLGPFQRNARVTSAEGGTRRLPARTANSASSFVHHLWAPHSCGREWGGPQGASAPTERGGTGKVADSIVGNPPHRAGWGRRTGLGSVSDREETWRFQAKAS